MSAIGIVVSCGDSVERGWRAELDLGGGKSLDDHHLSATFGAEPTRGNFCFGLRWLYCVEYLKAKRQESGAPPVGKEASFMNF